MSERTGIRFTANPFLQDRQSRTKCVATVPSGSIRHAVIPFKSRKRTVSIDSESHAAIVAEHTPVYAALSPSPAAPRRRDRHIAWEQTELASRGRYARTIGELEAQFPMLSKAELRICALLRNVESVTMIAELLGVRVKTIENHKRNIRKKLGLAPGASILEHLRRTSKEWQRSAQGKNRNVSEIGGLLGAESG